MFCIAGIQMSSVENLHEEILYKHIISMKVTYVPESKNPRARKLHESLRERMVRFLTAKAPRKLEMFFHYFLSGA